MKKVMVFFSVALVMLAFTSVAEANLGKKLSHRHLRGAIVSLDASTSAVTFDRLKGENATLTVTPKTVIRKNGRVVDFDRLALGDRGHAKFAREESGELRALKIFVHTPFMNGKIIEVTSDTVTLKRPKKTRTFVVVDGDTKIRRNGAAAGLADLKVGDAAKVYYNKTEAGDFLARRIKAAGKRK